jgi:hypothetical protein
MSYQPLREESVELSQFTEKAAFGQAPPPPVAMATPTVHYTQPSLMVIFYLMVFYSLLRWLLTLVSE